MKITIYSKNDAIDKFYKDSIKEYYKRFSRICKINIVVFDKIEQISKKLDKNLQTIWINSAGNLVSSTELANTINMFNISGYSSVNIVLCDTIIANDIDNSKIHHLAISKLTMSTGLTLAILYEQIYRSFTIIDGKTYHK